MDMAQLNRIAQQVADTVQQRETLHFLRLTLWQRGIADPDAYILTGCLYRSGGSVYRFEWGQTRLQDLLIQSDDQAAQSLEAMLMQEIQRGPQ